MISQDAVVDEFPAERIRDDHYDALGWGWGRVGLSDVDVEVVESGGLAFGSARVNVAGEAVGAGHVGYLVLWCGVVWWFV